MIKGKIIKGIAGFYYVHDGENTIYECKAKGIFRNKNLKPLVGDDVEIEILDHEEKLGNIVEIFPRNNSLIRPAVANVDQALVIFAIHNPEPNYNLLDRFLVMMEMQDIPCHVCFNKTDLSGEEELNKVRSIYEKAGYPVHMISTVSFTGIEPLKDVLLGKTTVMAGPSGVGKSSLINTIFPEAQMETGSVSKKIKRGRHTTRHSELFSIAEHSYMLDTPGFSSLSIENLECNELRFYYPEIYKLEGDCRFQGCVHDKEPDCSVKEAVKKGTIDTIRYENYLQIFEELKSKKRY